jgi:hypothetical protein
MRWTSKYYTVPDIGLEDYAGRSLIFEKADISPRVKERLLTGKKRQIKKMLQIADILIR